jgi:hypothetical protein
MYSCKVLPYIVMYKIFDPKMKKLNTVNKISTQNSNTYDRLSKMRQTEVIEEEQKSKQAEY